MRSIPPGLDAYRCIAAAIFLASLFFGLSDSPSAAAREPGRNSFATRSAIPQEPLSGARHGGWVAIDWEDAFHRIEFFAELGQGDHPVILVLSGELNARTTPQLEAAVALLGAGRPLNLLIDLEHVTVCDASSILALISSFGRIRAAGGSASIICPSRVALRALEVEKVFEYLTNGDQKQL